MKLRFDRAGFSLIEALVVLAISGMALAVIFSIGVRAGDSGFALGRRAMSAADQDIAVADLRSIFRSVIVQPSRTLRPEIDQPFFGTSDRFEGQVVMERATQCAPAGWSGRVILDVERQGEGSVLVCQAGTYRRRLLESRERNATLSYSRDGRSWSQAATNAQATASDPGSVKSEVLYIRFSGGPQSDVLEMASSGRPEVWARATDAF